MNKLYPIAELIKDLLEEKFKYKVYYTLEARQVWLENYPSRENYLEFWDDIGHVYSYLIDSEWTLNKVMKNSNNIRTRKAAIDIWFAEPYNFICEFDEKQHFNQYRLITLEQGYENLDISFDYDEYLTLCKSKFLKAGKSGFHKLKSKDILFPAMYEGEKQDNRIRQRAFRDYLKDIVPVKLGYNPTMRINYRVTNGSIKNFTEADLEAVKEYIHKNKLLDNIILNK